MKERTENQWWGGDQDKWHMNISNLWDRLSTLKPGDVLICINHWAFPGNPPESYVDPDVTQGKEYELIRIDNQSVVIKDNTGEEHNYNPCIFIKKAI